MEEGKRIVFIGDSITEWGKDDDQEQIGTGYVRLIHDYLKVAYPAERLEIVNKGVGGDRITDLAGRWEKDVIALHPDVVSISIGINDVWRQLDNPDMEQVYPEAFEKVYRDLLSGVKAKTNAKIVLMEPTLIEEDIHSVGNERLKPYVEVIQNLALTYQAILVPTHLAFIDYLQLSRSYHLTSDGVHMNSTGNMLMAKSWLQATVSLFGSDKK